MVIFAKKSPKGFFELIVSVPLFSFFMFNFSLLFSRNTLVLVFLFLFSFSLLSKSDDNCCEDAEIHEITLFAIPTMYPLDWSSPASLYRSMLSCYTKTFFLSDNYLLGHLAVRLNSPLLDEPRLVAMTSADRYERLDMIFNQKIGFGILGSNWNGRLEGDVELNHMLNVYARRDKLAFVTYRIRKEAMEKILLFVEKFASNMNGIYSPSSFYGGTFWPLYHNEGSGCSNFGIAMLELAGLIDDDVLSWELRKRIPMEIIGGDFNDGKRVRFRSIRQTDSWAQDGEANVDWIEYQVFEPSIMFDWILEARQANRSDYIPITKLGVPGLYFDGRNADFDPNHPIFYSRPKPNLFVDRFLKQFDFADN